jgi:hypothetical protein
LNGDIIAASNIMLNNFLFLRPQFTDSIHFTRVSVRGCSIIIKKMELVTMLVMMMMLMPLLLLMIMILIMMKKKVVMMSILPPYCKMMEKASKCCN